MVAVAWWRGRRLGALATEPLPVTVRAIETTHAAVGSTATPATGSTPRTRSDSTPGPPRRSTCGLPPQDTDALVRDVAHAVGRPADEVAALLDDTAPPPRTDDDLIHLATALAELDREVRAT